MSLTDLSLYVGFGGLIGYVAWMLAGTIHTVAPGARSTWMIMLSLVAYASLWWVSRP